MFRRRKKSDIFILKFFPASLCFACEQFEVVFVEGMGQRGHQRVPGTELSLFSEKQSLPAAPAPSQPQLWADGFHERSWKQQDPPHRDTLCSEPLQVLNCGKQRRCKALRKLQKAKLRMEKCREGQGARPRNDNAVSCAETAPRKCVKEDWKYGNLIMKLHPLF